MNPSGERYVALGLARVRAPWFADVARWSTSGSLALDFVKTVSAEEVRARLATGRAFSALLVDGGVHGVDRDLLEAAREHGCAPIVVSDGVGRDFHTMGAVATLHPSFDRDDLAAVLSDHAAPIGRADEVPGEPHHDLVRPGFRARTIVVTGPGGTGRSTVAAAVAQGFASDVTHSDTVVLADLALHADQGMLHDAGDVIPGVLELVESHRSGAPCPDEVRALTFDIAARRYRLLLGLRRHRDWTALRPGAVRAALDGLRQAFTLVVADVDDDLEGESSTGSVDVEDRNLLARSVLSVADVVVVVGAPGVKGVHSLLRVVREWSDAGVDIPRIVPVVNRAPKRRGARAEMGRAVHELLRAGAPENRVLSPVFLPERRHLDDIVRDNVALPSTIVEPIVRAVRNRLEAVDTRQTTPIDHLEPQQVAVGSVGSWDEGMAG